MAPPRSYLYGRAGLGAAKELYERALQIFEVAYGPDHPEVARTLVNLGIVLHDLGDLEGARDRQQRAHRIAEQNSLAEGHSRGPGDTS